MQQVQLKVEHSLSDHEIVSAFSKDETRELAFTWLVRRDQKKIYWFIRRMVIDHEDANDLVQEVFISVWKSFPRFRGESTICTWLYKIATNVTLTFLKRKKADRSWISFNQEDDLKEKLYSGNYIDGDAIELKLQRAILSLPDTQRLIFQLRYFDDFTYEEISQVLEVSVGALKADYHLAAKKVESFLKRND